jgi:hypothetical protein
VKDALDARKPQALREALGAIDWTDVSLDLQMQLWESDLDGEGGVPSADEREQNRKAEECHQAMLADERLLAALRERVAVYGFGGDAMAELVAKALLRGGDDDERARTMPLFAKKLAAQWSVESMGRIEAACLGETMSRRQKILILESWAVDSRGSRRWGAMAQECAQSLAWMLDRGWVEREDLPEMLDVVLADRAADINESIPKTLIEAIGSREASEHPRAQAWAKHLLRRRENSAFAAAWEPLAQWARAVVERREIEATAGAAEAAEEPEKKGAKKRARASSRI